jgi:cupin 2 domain-containing protein
VALHGSIFRDLPDATRTECLEELCRSKSFRVERITSSGQSSPADFCYDQPWDEWVLVLQGWAVIQLLEPEEAVHLSSGDWLMIKAHRQHRVFATSHKPVTIWLAVHALVLSSCGERNGCPAAKVKNLDSK